MKSHELIDQRSLAFGRAIAKRIRADASCIGRAKEHVRLALETCSPRVLSTLLEWQAALDGPIDGVVQILTAEEERAVRLRQSSPFAGVLPQQQRLEIIRRFNRYDSDTA